MGGLVHRIGHRGAALLFFALLDAVYAFNLLKPPTSVAQRDTIFTLVRDLAPLPAWATLWATSGAVCLVCAFRRKDQWGFAAAMLVKVLWGGLYIYGALLGIERAYLGAAIWLCLAGWIGVISTWPTPTDKV